VKSNIERTKFLLDTSYILPTLGINTGSEIERDMKSLANAKPEIYYSRFSLLESLWVAARIQEDKFDRERFTLGLRSITEGETYTRVEEDSEIFTQALKRYRQGHRDMIDNILYESAVRLKLALFTRDKELKKFIREKGLKDICSP
jgi:predicted nucleic acid-binding protein